MSSQPNKTRKPNYQKIHFLMQNQLWNTFLVETRCLGSGSVGSATYWLPRSGSRSRSGKIWGSTDPNPRCKISTKNWSKIFYAQNPNLLKKERLSKISFPECFINNGKKERNIIWNIFFSLVTWIRIDFSSEDPGSGSKLNGSYWLLESVSFSV